MSGGSTAAYVWSNIICTMYTRGHQMANLSSPSHMLVIIACQIKVNCLFGRRNSGTQNRTEGAGVMEDVGEVKS